MKSLTSPEEAVVVGLGRACVDFLGSVPQYPCENGKVELEALSIQCGGPVATAMAALAKFGVSTSFMPCF